MEVKETFGSFPTVAIKNLTFPLRVNVGFSLEGKVDLYARTLNANLVAYGHTDINFSSGYAIPHVTLLMGKVKNQEDLRNLIAEVAKLINQHEPLGFNVSAPYFSGTEEGYVFLDVVPQMPFRDLKLSLYAQVSNLLECELHGGPTNISHITVGHVKATGFDMQELGAISKHAARGLARTIIITEVGVRGTCKRLITDVGRSPHSP